ncbi:MULTISPECIES: transcription termination factor Rho [Salimicrobium]|uniref:Transcription termination factor Rho n=1 Tax=Salimicrobium humidisoli TaxID=2029857 RepID=A0ABX4HU97_9BACI|nr:MULTISPECIES: transcription termination factor Rho [Salimicrobium]PBB06399.1 transcription termination factor Rho [Salimicrobium humidisoli]
MAELNISSLETLKLKDLYDKAREYKVSYYSKLTKRELIFAILKAQAEKDGYLFMDGILEIIPSEGFGFLRPINYSPSAEDIYISASQIRRFDLRNGDKVSGKVRPPKENERYYGLLHVDAVNGEDPDSAKQRVHFPALTPLYPDRHMNLEVAQNQLATRIMDVMAPVGYGQRGLIVAPPKAGKTMLLKQMANSIAKNHPDSKLIILLVDERPEEVTDIERSVAPDVDVVSSTFDEVPENHIKVSELVLERSMRLVEHKRDVIVLMDSITRLARAYNLVIPPSGRTLSGGIDPASFHRPKRFFGAARNIEEGGSLTILATALVDTGSKMDDVIYEEFKGTGNMELHLDRNLAERRIFPSIDLKRSGTRKEELLLSKEQLEKMWAIRQAMTSSHDFYERFLRRMKKSKDNREFFDVMDKEMNQTSKK